MKSMETATATVIEMMDTFCYDDIKLDLLMKDVGNRIQEERIKRNISITQLAALSNVSHSHINRIENGQRKPGLEPLLKICTALSISIMDVLPIEQAQHIITNGERFDRITKNSSIKVINLLLDMAEKMVKIESE